MVSRNDKQNPTYMKLIIVACLWLSIICLLDSSRVAAQQFGGFSSQAYFRLSDLTLPPELPATQGYMRPIPEWTNDSSKRAKKLARRVFYPQGIISTQWSVGVVADGDFSRAITDNSVKPRTGQVGFEAVHTAQIWELVTPEKVNYQKVNTLLNNARARRALLDSLPKVQSRLEAAQRQQVTAQAELRRLRGQADTLAQAQALQLKSALIQQLTSQEKELQKQLANANQPLLLTARAYPKLIFNFLISLGNLDDSLRGSLNRTNPLAPQVTPRGLFGSSLLVPGSAAAVGRSVSANVVWRPFNGYQRHSSIWWLHGFANYSSSHWVVDKQNSPINILSLSVGPQYTVFKTRAKRKADDTRDGNDVQFTLGVDATMRGISGEILIDENTEFRKNILGTERRAFWGVEPMALLTINSFRVTFSVPYFYDGHFIPGFSGGYPVVGFGFANVLQAAASDASHPRAWLKRRFLGRWR